MTPQDLGEMWTRATEQLLTENPSMKALSNDVLTLVPEVRRLQQLEAVTRLFAMLVPPCDCGAYEFGRDPCGANCRIDVRFRTALQGENPVSI